jgi:hypothetical protein
MLGRAWAAGLLLVAVAPFARADDVIVLKNGARVEGKVVDDDGETVTIEKTLAGGRTRIAVPWSSIFELHKDEKATATSKAPLSNAAVRDEWWLLKSGGRIVGTRHLILSRHLGECGKGWRLEEQVALFAASPRVPAVHVQRLEEVDDLFLPRLLHYREVGEGASSFGVESYEVIHTGPVKDGVWRMSEHGRGAERSGERAVAVPAGARGPLGTREWLLRAPRTPGLAEHAVLDPREAAVRRVRAGFSAVGSGAGDGREDVLRVEDGDLALETRCVGGECRSEDVAPGVTAVLSNERQAAAAALDPTGSGAGGNREVVIPQCGIALRLPGASWTAEVYPLRPSEEERRVVAKLASDLHVADVRVEWEPKGVVQSPLPAEAPETALVARLRSVSPDVTVLDARRAVDGVPGAWRVGLLGTVREERVRTLALVAERGEGRVTMLASCQEAAWPDVRGALEAVLESFRWL